MQESTFINSMGDTNIGSITNHMAIDTSRVVNVIQVVYSGIDILLVRLFFNYSKI